MPDVAATMSLSREAVAVADLEAGGHSPQLE